MPNITLYKEYRLIERKDTAINRAWKGAHLLLFFLAFVFGSFCTFCFHMLMYLFDEKCVLFPKLLSLTSMRHNVIYEFIPSKKDLSDLPVDFLSTQWVEKSTCALPTYVPLVSGIFGLVWTTLFLMCSTGSRTLTGLQRPWRVLPPVFIFSLAMCALCAYSSAVTHYGLQELCNKLGEITGSSTCTYTVNVVTLAYERRIRGVYQATHLTIASAWLHTSCWFFSALLAVVRILLVVDFQVVRITASLKTDIDAIMERNETQLKSISPNNLWVNSEYNSGSDNSYPSKPNYNANDDLTELHRNHDEILYSNSPKELVRAEMFNMDETAVHRSIQKRTDLLDKINLPDNKMTTSYKTEIVKQKSSKSELYGTNKVKNQVKNVYIATANDEDLINIYTDRLIMPVVAGTSETHIEDEESTRDLTIKFKRDKTRRCMKSQLKAAMAQTEVEIKPLEKSVIISYNIDNEQDHTITHIIQQDNETQTRKKEKQD